MRINPEMRNQIRGVIIYLEDLLVEVDEERRLRKYWKRKYEALAKNHSRLKKKWGVEE